MKEQPNLPGVSRASGSESPRESDALEALGFLVDALSDHLAWEVTNSDPEMRSAVKRACEVLGGPYAPYLEGVWVQ